MSLLKIALVGFALVLISVMVVAIAMFIGPPSPIPSLMGTTAFLLGFYLVMYASKPKKKAEVMS